MSFRRVVSIVLLLAVGALGWAPSVRAACDRPCCVGAASTSTPQMAHPAADGCCCNLPENPCELARGQASEAPVVSVVSVPRLPRAGSLVLAVASPEGGSTPSFSGFDPGTFPLGQAPSPPLFLRHVSLLC